MPTPGPLPEYDHEMTVTRQVLERVPDDRPEWRPHPKSFPIGHLAQLVAIMPGWLVAIIRQPDLDLAASGGYTFEPTAALLALFDATVREGREALAAVTPADLDVPWSLRHGDRVLSTDARGVVVRTHLSHMVHHRAQLAMYLRLLDVPVPGMYGPSADARW